MNLTSIVTLLQLILALLSNPTTANNPSIQSLAQQAVSEAAQALAQEQTPVQVSSSTISYSVPTSTNNTQPIVINVTNPPTNQPTQTSSTLESAGSTSTPALTDVPFSSIANPNGTWEILVQGGSSLNLNLDATKGPFDITYTILNPTPGITATQCTSNLASSCLTTQTDKVNDPAYPDGLAANLMFSNLATDTTYQYEVDISGSGWQTSSTGEFTTTPGGTYTMDGINIY